MPSHLQVVLGATGGVGQALVQTLATQGAQVRAVNRSLCRVWLAAPVSLIAEFARHSMGPRNAVRVLRPHGGEDAQDDEIERPLQEFDALDAPRLFTWHPSEVSIPALYLVVKCSRRGRDRMRRTS